MYGLQNAAATVSSAGHDLWQSNQATQLSFLTKPKVGVYLVILLSVMSNQKSNLHYSRGMTPKHLTSGGAHHRGLAPGQHSSEETSQRW